ncbi:DNA alkylation repair protein [Vagococcus bubulae]|uniref:DNA alkylation repair protein n=1 Tax=Vagococcus bubulae TaxID=1977868 RepID=A0A429ZR99_9ENTE|nr:DNA alkylation repair protein [Vagococcus bubulae]RST96191.1 DNA alkylation repair protein [Vagococcus bubulae]
MTPTQEKLFSMQDRTYKVFNAKLIPTVNPDKVIGVRMPQLRKLAKEMIKNDDTAHFLSELPHTYHEENVLHMLIISSTKDFEEAIKAYQTFLPYADNWAVTDCQTPTVFKKNPEKLLPFIDEWLTSSEEYTVRFAILQLMNIYLVDENFNQSILDRVCEVKSEAYYVNMMRAWFFATSLAKQYDATIAYISERKLDDWTHQKTIQKARESLRISPETKDYLKTLKKPSN